MGLSALWAAVTDFMGAALGFSFIDSIEKLMDDVWQFFSHEILEPIANFLGFEDEIVYLTDVVAVKVFEESILPETTVQAALRMQANSLGAVDFLGEFETRGNAQFNKYFRRGKYSYTDHLPECQITTITVPAQEVETVLENAVGTSVVIQDILVNVPSDSYWCKYQLQNQYDYNLSTDSVFINDVYYVYGKHYYNENTDKFEVTLNNITSVQQKTYETRSIFVAGTVDVEETDASTGVVQIVTKEIKRTLVYQRFVYNRNDTGMFLYETEDTLVSSTDEIVDLGTTVSTKHFNLVSDTVVTYPSNPLVVYIDDHNNTRQYIVKYRINDSRSYLWMYDPSTNEYPQLAAPVNAIAKLEVYPIVMLRNAFFDVSEYNIETKTIDGETVSRPSTITKERYDDTLEMIGALNIQLSDLVDAYSENPDVDKMQDVFFGLSVSPSNTAEIVSKVLFELFDFIYDKLPPVADSNSYAATFKEEPFNASITWIPVGVEIYDGKVGDLGFCKHTIFDRTYKAKKVQTTVYDYLGNSKWGITTTITNEIYHESELVSTNVEDTTYKEDLDYDGIYTPGIVTTVKKEVTEIGKDLVIERQLTTDTVKRISLRKLDGFHIVRRGVSDGGVTLEIDNKNFIIPLPVDVVDRLSIMEKTALLSEAVYMLFYAYDEQHLRWYETEKFMTLIKVFVIIIMIVITILSFGTATPFTTTGTAALFAILEAVFYMLLVAVVVHVTLKFIAKYVDNPALKAALSAAVMVVAMWAGGGFEAFDMLTAVQLVAISAEAVSIYVGDIQLDLQEEINSVNSLYKSRMETLEEASKALDTGIGTEFVTGLVTDLGLSGGYRKASQYRVYTPDQFKYMSLEAFRDHNALHRNAVEIFNNNRNNRFATWA